MRSSRSLDKLTPDPGNIKGIRPGPLLCHDKLLTCNAGGMDFWIEVNLAKENASQNAACFDFIKKSSACFIHI